MHNDTWLEQHFEYLIRANTLTLRARSLFNFVICASERAFALRDTLTLKKLISNICVEYQQRRKKKKKKTQRSQKKTKKKKIFYKINK